MSAASLFRAVFVLFVSVSLGLVPSFSVPLVFVPVALPPFVLAPPGFTVVEPFVFVPFELVPLLLVPLAFVSCVFAPVLLIFFTSSLSCRPVKLFHGVVNLKVV